MKATKLVGVLVACMGLAACQATVPQSQEAGSADRQEGQTDEGGQTGEAPQTYTLEQVAEHGSAEDCFIAIEGKVYDVSEFIVDQAHPGGPAILQGCGNDASELYNNRPNGSGAHSGKARAMLEQYYIGDLAE